MVTIHEWKKSQALTERLFRFRRFLSDFRCSSRQSSEIRQGFLIEMSFVETAGDLREIDRISVKMVLRAGPKAHLWQEQLV
jgi:hypothetical protein